MYAKVTFQQGLPENAHTVVASFGDPTGRLDRDFWARDIECRNLTAAETVTGREVVVREAMRSDTFVPGFTGRGFRILEDGSAEMRRLVLHDALEVPELRYNRITAVGGQLWVTSAGTIRSAVDNGNGTWTLTFKLEEGEVHEFGVDDILRAVFHTQTGFQTGIYRVMENLDTSSVLVSIVEGCQPQAAMTVVRMGNYSDPSRQNSIYLDGYHGYERILEGVDTPGFGADKVVYQAGVLDGLTTEAFGTLEGIGLYCRNLYAEGAFRVKVNGVSTDVGTQFEVTEEGISALVTKTETIDGRLVNAESSIAVQAGQIAAKVSLTEFNALGERVSTAESAIAQQAGEISLKVSQSSFDELGNRVTTAESTIRQLADSIELQVTTEDLAAVGIRIDGEDRGVHMRADLFDIISVSGMKLLEASSDGNRVTLRNVDITGTATIGEGALIGDMIIRNGELYYLDDADNRQCSVGSAAIQESGDTIVASFLVGDDAFGNRRDAVRIQGNLDLTASTLKGFALNLKTITTNGYVNLSLSHPIIYCANSAELKVVLPYNAPNGTVMFVTRRTNAEVYVCSVNPNDNLGSSSAITINWGESGSAKEFRIGNKGHTVMAIRCGMVWLVNVIGWG